MNPPSGFISGQSFVLARAVGCGLRRGFGAVGCGAEDAAGKWRGELGGHKRRWKGRRVAVHALLGYPVTAWILLDSRGLTWARLVCLGVLGLM